MCINDIYLNQREIGTGKEEQWEQRKMKQKKKGRRQMGRELTEEAMHM